MPFYFSIKHIDISTFFNNNVYQCVPEMLKKTLQKAIDFDKKWHYNVFEGSWN